MAKLKFNEKEHKYTIGKKELESVTTFIGKFFSPFDAKGIARKLAKFPVNKSAKHGVRYFLKIWKQAAEHGTETHQLIEYNILGKQIKDIGKYETRSLLKAHHACEWLRSQDFFRLGESFPESRVFDEELGLAGTIDLCVEDCDGLTLVDWKSNKDIKKKSYKSKKCFEPIEELDDCSYNKYTLQLSMYAYIMERKGINIKKLILLHAKEDGVQEYEVPYRKDLVEKMIKHEK